MNTNLNDKEIQSHQLEWLFLDMNSYFASCEQQVHPNLRGKPVAVVPTDAETTCAIAASYEAKAFGVKTGTIIKDARKMCPELICVQSTPRIYVEYHHRFLEAIETCIPIEDVMSVDEVACRLDKTQKTPEAVRQLAARIKTIMHKDVGECLTCSIGVASNKLLAKLASNMQKPDGLTILEPRNMPEAILHLPPNAINGIGPRMALRLADHDITTMDALWHADTAAMRRVWGGVVGARFHALLHGEDLPSPSSPRRSLGHQHVLPPQERTLAKATPIIRQLLSRASLKLRQEDFYAKRMMLQIKWAGQQGHFVKDIRFNETQDTALLMREMMKLWQMAPPLRPLRVGVVLADLVHRTKHQFDLFSAPKNTNLTQAVDTINDKFGRGTIALGRTGDIIKSKIAFSSVPALEET